MVFAVNNDIKDVIPIWANYKYNEIACERGITHLSDKKRGTFQIIVLLFVS